MATNVIMPALEMAQETGTVVRWLKRAGEAVTKGEPIVEIETDKVTVEIEAPASGTLGAITAHDGDVVPVGQPIAVILAAGESAMAATAGAPAGARAVSPPPAVRRASAPAHAEERTGGRVLASPKARRLAAERGVDLASMRGSGPAGAVLAADVTAAAPPRRAERGLSSVWRVMAERMTASWTTAPHFYLLREVDASRLSAWRTQVNKQAAGRVTYTDLLVKVVAVALRQHPGVNAAWREGGIARNEDVNIGVAVAVDEGLIVPVIHGADGLSVAAIADRRSDLVARAQAGKLRPDDVQGAGFTISNLGMYGVDAFNAIVNPPQAAILAVGRIAERVMAVNGQAVVRPTLMLSLSGDHRAIDGARGAQFLGAVAELIEEPLALLG